MSPKLPRKIIKKTIRVIHHTGLKAKKPRAMGADNANAVKKANCCGVKFFVESIFKTGGHYYWLIR